MSKVTRTRVKLACEIVGEAKKCAENVLPSNGDILRHFLYSYRSLMLIKKTKKNPSSKEIIIELARFVQHIWNKASIPTVSEERCFTKIKNLYDEYQKLKKYTKKQKGTVPYKTRKALFTKKLDCLFDICSCKCADLSLCSCARARKVPKEEHSFLLDQRSLRKMVIGSIDVPASEQLQRRLLRKQQRENVSEPGCSNYSPRIEDESHCEMSSPSQSKSSSDSEEYKLYKRVPKKVKQKKNMTRKISNLALACDRTGVSDRAASLIATAVIKDFGIDQTQTIDRSKLRRARQSKRLMKLKERTGKHILGLFFDSRKDKTLMKVQKGKTTTKETTVEEHVALVEEPGSVYLGHKSMKDGKATSYLAAITSFIEENHIQTDQLCVLGCDGTNINTGWRGGAITLLEKHFETSFQWMICLLHTNELPLRHLLQYLDGSTTGPSSYSGVIGKLLETCENKETVTYETLESNMPPMEPNLDLSTDQSYLRDIVIAISTGMVSESLARRNPGHMSHARWLTTANRILRLYVSTENPKSELKTLAQFIMKVYAPVWFFIKKNPTFKDAPKHLFRMIQFSRYLPSELKKIIDPIIQRNGFWGHPENLLLAMVYDSRLEIQEKALALIQQARATPMTRKKFIVPKLNFEALDYTELIDWNAVGQITEPPVIKKLVGNVSVDALENIPMFPCHTQAVERCIKLITEASLKVCGESERDGFILSKIQSQKDIPKLDTKKNLIG